MKENYFITIFIQIKMRFDLTKQNAFVSWLFYVIKTQHKQIMFFIANERLK